MLLIYSDKTGTLTENVMVFKEVVVSPIFKTIMITLGKKCTFALSHNEKTDQACLGGGEYSEAELQYRRPLPMCSFSDLTGRYTYTRTHLHSCLASLSTIYRGDEGEARREGSEERQIAEFLTALALCHTVQVAIQPTQIQCLPQSSVSISSGS